jgi:hypothetical protein
MHPYGVKGDFPAFRDQLSKINSSTPKGYIRD